MREILCADVDFEALLRGQLVQHSPKPRQKPFLPAKRQLFRRHVLAHCSSGLGGNTVNFGGNMVNFGGNMANFSIRKMERGCSLWDAGCVLFVVLKFGFLVVLVILLLLLLGLCNRAGQQPLTANGFQRNEPNPAMLE